MPELPDITAYLTALEPRVIGRELVHVSTFNPFVLRTTEPPISALEGRRVRALRRIGKRIAFGFDDDLWMVVHLMIAGRFQWIDAPSGRTPAATALAAFQFSNGTLLLTEAGSKRRASIQVVAGEAALAALDPGGIEPLRCDLDGFRKAFSIENRTLKRALTDPHIVSGIGNAYSDEILHAARLSPVALTHKLNDEQWLRLFEATRETLTSWIERLDAEAAHAFPSKVTAFRPEMAVHGKYKQPCPRCGRPVQRIRYADNETNYCAMCQTGGKLLADRGLSRLLKDDWPKTLDELESSRS